MLTSVLGRHGASGAPGALLLTASLLLGAVVVEMAPGSELAAQTPTETSRWFPDEPLFLPPLASAREPRFAGALLASSLFRGRHQPLERAPYQLSRREGLARDPHGEVALGGTLPIWEGGGAGATRVMAGIEGGVFARFRLAPTTNDLVGSDWMAALPIHTARGPVTSRFRIIHWSSHLGDELIERAEADRIVFSRDGVDLLVAYDPASAVRLYGGGEWVVRSQTAIQLADQPATVDERLGVQGGAEAAWEIRGSGGPTVRAGVDWKAADRADWRSRLGISGGVEVRNGRRLGQLLVRHVRGPSSLGQFFLSHEELWGVELVVRW